MKFTNFIFVSLITFAILLLAVNGKASSQKTHKLKRAGNGVLGINKVNNNVSEPIEKLLRGRAVLAAALPRGELLNRAGWTVAVNSFQPGYEAEKVLDNNPTSFWHTKFDPAVDAFPHSITIDMKHIYHVSGLTILPRQDSLNGNIGQHVISVSIDGFNFSPIAYGTFLDDRSSKSVSIQTTSARFIRIQTFTEAGNRGALTSFAELNVYKDHLAHTPPGIGSWGFTINLPLVPVTAAVEPGTGKVIMWSSHSPENFAEGPGGRTVTATWDPTNWAVSQCTITNTQHDMFCPGTSIDANGRVVVTGGNNAEKTSVYDFSKESWYTASNMRIARGYHASAVCSDGRIFAIGGSFSGGLNGKNGEIFDPNQNSWSPLPRCPVDAMVTSDREGIWRADNHAWLFGWKYSYVFQAGPSRAMNWYNTAGEGGQAGAGNRANDPDAMCGNAIMFDAVGGKILTVGGSPHYTGSPGAADAHVITLGEPNTNPYVEKVGSLAIGRTFANAVILADGKTLIVGGHIMGSVFSDNGAVLTPEIFDPATNKFCSMANHVIPRTYHSVALLLMDGTVFVGGGGLCGDCNANHFDAQVYTPPYLLTPSGAPATRPTIISVSESDVRVGATITITTNSDINKISLVRFGSTTHTVNTDQRCIMLHPTWVSTNTYSVVVPHDSGVSIPGYWMLFALNPDGVPSIAKSIRVRL